MGPLRGDGKLSSSGSTACSNILRTNSVGRWRSGDVGDFGGGIGDAIAEWAPCWYQPQPIYPHSVLTFLLVRVPVVCRFVSKKRPAASQPVSVEWRGLLTFKCAFQLGPDLHAMTTMIEQTRPLLAKAWGTGLVR